MRIFTIAYYTIKRNFRDRKSMSLTMLFPILLILILGSALSKIYSPPNFAKIEVAYANEDKGQMAAQFDQFLNNKDIKNMLNIKSVGSMEEGLQLVKNKKAEALIYIGKGYTSGAVSGQKSQIKVYQDGSDAINVSVVKNLVESFNNGANTIQALYKMGSSSSTYSEANLIQDMPITEHGNVPRAIDYYAVTMLAMTLMYGTLYASFGMAEDKIVKTNIRIKSSPTKDYENYLGKTLGTIFTLILQVLIIIVFTKSVYHVNWGSNMPMIVFLSSLFAVFATGLGIFAYAITNNTMRASAILNILAVCMTFVSGGYAKIGYTGSIFDKIVFFAPNKMFQTAIFNTIYSGPSSETQTCIIGITIITVVLFGIASTFGRKVLN